MTFKTSIKRAAEIDAASKGEEHLMSGIRHPGLHDCLCGRGGHATNHPGNVHFRMLVSKYKPSYAGLSRYGKLQVAGEVVKLWRSQTPPGRFLAMDDPSNRETTTWYDVGEKEAIKKTSQCLRERIPPHQKARKLAITSAALTPSEGTTNQSSGGAPQEKGQKSTPSFTAGSAIISSSVPSGGSETAQVQTGTTDDKFQPIPLLEPALVSLPSTPATLPRPLVKEISATEQDQNRSLSPIQVPLPRSVSSNSGQSVKSWTPSVSSLDNDDFAFLAEAFSDEPENSDSYDVDTYMKYDNTNETNGAEDVDGSTIPSAADLTRFAFDWNNVYVQKPLMGGTTRKIVGGQQNPAPMTLNQTLSSGFTNSFRFSF